LLWGAPRIHGELLKLGIEVAQSTNRGGVLHLLPVARLLERVRRTINRRLVEMPTG